MKKTTKKLQLNKITIATLNNRDCIMGGLGTITTKPNSIGTCTIRYSERVSCTCPLVPFTNTCNTDPGPGTQTNIRCDP